jgi:EthD domain
VPVPLEKRVYLAWRESDADGGGYAHWLLREQAPRLLALGPARLRLCVADVEAQFAVVAPVDGPGGVLSACVSAWLEPGPAELAIEQLLAEGSLRVGRYATREAIPVAYPDRSWADGERTPGACLVSAFTRRAELEEAEFLRRWHEVHTPLSLEIHPLWSYVRNVVEKTLTPGAPAWDGIVEEQVRELEDLTDPLRWYGSDENLERGLADAQSFIDFDRMECQLMSEYILRS